MSHDDFETEPIPGLPARLPEGEKILWQGSPDAGAVLRHLLHGRLIAAYFLVLAAWRIAAGITDGRAVSDIATSTLWAVMMGAVVLLLAWLYARAVARTTIYTITHKRLVMRFSVAVPVTFNLPFTQIVSADFLDIGNERGTLSVALKEHTKVSWLVLWPHARPWRLASPQPALRFIPDAASVASLLAERLHTAHAMQPKPLVRDAPSIPASAPVALQTGSA